MKDITQFDAEFFRYPPVLAERADPQQRMLLEVVYETIIDAGLLIIFISLFCYPIHTLCLVLLQIHIIYLY